LAASPVIGGTTFLVVAALWLGSRTTFQFYPFFQLRRAAHPNSKWVAVLAVCWLLMTAGFLKFVAFYHFFQR
jgi:hypothetical protein